jgi:putative endonuclease
MALHCQRLIDGFTKTYRVHRLVYYEMHESMGEAIRREKQLKKWNRAWKIRLIEQMNHDWKDLFDDKTGEICEGPTDQRRRTF